MQKNCVSCCTACAVTAEDCPNCGASLDGVAPTGAQCTSSFVVSAAFVGKTVVPAVIDKAVPTRCGSQGVAHKAPPQVEANETRNSSKEISRNANSSKESTSSHKKYDDSPLFSEDDYFLPDGTVNPEHVSGARRSSDSPVTTYGGPELPLTALLRRHSRDMPLGETFRNHVDDMQYAYAEKYMKSEALQLDIDMYRDHIEAIAASAEPPRDVEKYMRDVDNGTAELPRSRISLPAPPRSPQPPHSARSIPGSRRSSRDAGSIPESRRSSKDVGSIPGSRTSTKSQTDSSHHVKSPPELSDSDSGFGSEEEGVIDDHPSHHPSALQGRRASHGGEYTSKRNSLFAEEIRVNAPIAVPKLPQSIASRHSAGSYAKRHVATDARRSSAVSGAGGMTHAAMNRQRKEKVADGEFHANCAGSINGNIKNLAERARGRQSQGEVISDSWKKVPKSDNNLEQRRKSVEYQIACGNLEQRRKSLESLRSLTDTITSPQASGCSLPPISNNHNGSKLVRTADFGELYNSSIRETAVGM